MDPLSDSEDSPLLDARGVQINDTPQLHTASPPRGISSATYISASRPPLNPSSTIAVSNPATGSIKASLKRPPVEVVAAAGIPGTSKIGPQRTSKTIQKLKLLPEQPIIDDGRPSPDVITPIHKPMPRKHYHSDIQSPDDQNLNRNPERLTKSDRSSLPRVTAYCTSSSYKLKEMFRYIASRKSHQGTPRLFDECFYSAYSYRSDDSSENGQHDLVRVEEDGTEIRIGVARFSEIFVFQFGVVVLWGFTVAEEQRFLREIPRFENEKLAPQDVQVEELNYYITKLYQPRIHNDFIALRDVNNYMVKLSLSHAIAQSVKISLFEELVDNTILMTQDIPQGIAMTGKVQMSRKEIMMSIGELFILRININLHGSVIDSPELMWTEPQLEPIYQAMRSYLEINQRVSLLNQRLEVISDLLQMLKEQIGHAHEEYLELVVIILIAAEILVAIINIIIDLIAERG
ncbi:hypothetical protein V1511DRAFT_454992 [Dipodascopsis uninucleata]